MNYIVQWSRALAGALAVAAAAAGADAQAAEEKRALEHAPMHVGFTRSAFRNVKTTDAEAAFVVFAQTVGRQRGYILDISTRLFDDVADLRAETLKGSLSLVVLDSWEYVALDVDAEMEAAMVHLDQGVILKEHLLLVRRDSGIERLDQLRGKAIAVMSTQRTGIPMAWLESLLLEGSFGAIDCFFASLEVVSKPTAAVLPVFFGNKAACIVDRKAFELMVELNPQVGAQLTSIAVSEPYLNSVTLVTRTGYDSERVRQDVFKSLEELHMDAAGRQILTLFKVDQLMPFKDEYMDSVRALHDKLQRLRGAQDPAAAPQPAVAEGTL